MRRESCGDAAGRFLLKCKILGYTRDTDGGSVHAPRGLPGIQCHKDGSDELLRMENLGRVAVLRFRQ